MCYHQGGAEYNFRIGASKPRQKDPFQVSQSRTCMHFSSFSRTVEIRKTKCAVFAKQVTIASSIHLNLLFTVILILQLLDLGLLFFQLDSCRRS
jgi:hypothetical protein